MAEKAEAALVITGVHGQLGRAFAGAASQRGRTVVGCDIDTLDIRDREGVSRYVKDARPLAVINCAAMTAVDDCEINTAQAMEINGSAVANLAAACNEVGAQLVQISTDYVFSGRATRPYTEEDATGPLSAYGRSKVLGEELARSAHRHLIVRTAWLYGHGGRHFVGAIRSQIESGAHTLRVVDDQRGCPTLCDDLAAAVLDLIDKGAEDVVHAVNVGETSWHGFAVEIARLLGADVEILAAASDDLRRRAPRPAHSVLSTRRLETLIGRPLPPWQDALARFLGTPCAS
jgi:dTDP-4-dehydrorhamnose reductase